LQQTAEQQRNEAKNRAGKMSIQGVQPKYSAILNIKDQCFDIVDSSGRYILKPQHDYFESLPENEALTMKLAQIVGLEVPLHGLLYSIDQSMTYFIKRFDREKKYKFAVEDFAQLSGHSRETKYDSSLERIVDVVEQYCTFPMIEKVKLLKLTLFNFLTGNEDMHLKNYSLITKNNIVTLSPCYDLINTTIAQPNTKEEFALPLHGKKNNLKRKDLIDYFAKERLKLNDTIIQKTINEFINIQTTWHETIQISFLNPSLQAHYIALLEERAMRLHDLKT
jgi:serine/threonine-protein kinase HipA